MNTNPTADRDRIAEALYAHSHPGWATRYTDLDRDERDTYLARASAVLAVLPPPADRAAVLLEAEDDEGDELVCVDMCGSCDACGMEPFGTPAEGWREAARFLRRTARDSGDRQGALHGARLIEAELRRLADEAQQQCPNREPLDEAQCSKRGGHEGPHSDRPGRIWYPLPADEAQHPSPRCTCGETACESELCDCDSVPCPVDHAVEARQQPDTETRELPDRLEAVLAERFTELGNPFSRMRIAFQGPDGWPASKEVGPHDVALVLRELLADQPAVVSQPGKET